MHLRTRQRIGNATLWKSVLLFQTKTAFPKLVLVFDFYGYIGRHIFRLNELVKELNMKKKLSAYECYEKAANEQMSIAEYKALLIKNKIRILEKCPITSRPFFMFIKDDYGGWAPTFGGPKDSFTIPIEDEDGNWVTTRYSHDNDHWAEDIVLYNIGLTKENYFDKLYSKYPKAMGIFCDWIDEYKSNVGWGSYINNGLKFHDLPLDFQRGILYKFMQQHSDLILVSITDNIRTVFEGFIQLMNVTDLDKHYLNYVVGP